jgi:hypothetical protein
LLESPQNNSLCATTDTKSEQKYVSDQRSKRLKKEKRLRGKIKKRGKKKGGKDKGEI